LKIRFQNVPFKCSLHRYTLAVVEGTLGNLLRRVEEVSEQQLNYSVGLVGKRTS
jgi:hypothetical protein